VVDIATQTAELVEAALQRQELPLVLGGDCTIALGVIAGFLRQRGDLSLLYFDGHIDLNTPVTSRSGILDSMGIAHLIGETGAAEALRHLGPRFPQLSEDKIVALGYNPGEMNEAEHEVLARHPMLTYALAQVQGRARDAAREAVMQLEGRVERFVVHFDVDVIDVVDFPLADVPQINAGLTFQEAMACLEVFVASPQFAGLSLAEINPDHAHEEGILTTTFIENLVKVFAVKELEARG
jgi:arginase